MPSMDFRNPFDHTSSSSDSDLHHPHGQFAGSNANQQWQQDAFASVSAPTTSAEPVTQQPYSALTNPTAPARAIDEHTTFVDPTAGPNPFPSTAAPGPFQSTAPPPPTAAPGASTQQPPSQEQGSQFDIFEWYPKYQSCQKYFLNHAQSSDHVQAVAAFINIHLPFQHPTPIDTPRATGPTFKRPNPSQQPTHSSISLIPYLRRLVVTGLDFPGILHGFFGEDWAAGVGPLHEQERRNYLFAAKSGGWASVKRDYDMLPMETVPFMRPLQGPLDAEIEGAEKSWSEWLAMEDWMVGPRAPVHMGGGQGKRMEER